MHICMLIKNYKKKKNAYLDVLGCPRVSWGIKTDRIILIISVDLSNY